MAGRARQSRRARRRAHAKRTKFRAGERIVVKVGELAGTHGVVSGPISVSVGIGQAKGYRVWLDGEKALTRVARVFAGHELVREKPVPIEDRTALEAWLKS